MKKKPGDVVLSYRVNLTELQRTNRADVHIHAVALIVLDAMLTQIRAEPSITGKSVVWNGVNVGNVRVDW